MGVTVKDKADGASGDDGGADDNSTTRTVENISTADVLTLVWVSLGSPCGTVQEWLNRSGDNGVW